MTKQRKLVVKGHSLALRHNPQQGYKYLILATKPLTSLHNATLTIVGEPVTRDSVLVQAKSMDYDLSGYGCIRDQRVVVPHPHTGHQDDLVKLLQTYNIIGNDYSIQEYNDIIRNYVMPNNIADTNADTTGNMIMDDMTYQRHYIAWSYEHKKWVVLRCTRQTSPYQDVPDTTLVIPDIIKQELCDIHKSTGIPICCEYCSHPILHSSNLHITTDNIRYCNDCY